MKRFENYQYDWNLLRGIVEATLGISDSPFVLILGE